jgi:hypothetical protein
VFSWDIGLEWQIETDPATTSEIQVRFDAEGPDSTRVELEHATSAATVTAGRGCARPSQTRTGGSAGSTRSPPRRGRSAGCGVGRRHADAPPRA